MDIYIYRERERERENILRFLKESPNFYDDSDYYYSEKKCLI
jgi:hypothetical protein